MMTLLFDGTLLDSAGSAISELATLARDGGNFMNPETLGAVTFILFVGLSALTVMNMLIGIICEVVSEVATAERDDMAIKTLKRELLEKLMKAAGEDGPDTDECPNSNLALTK